MRGNEPRVRHSFAHSQHSRIGAFANEWGTLRSAGPPAAGHSQLKVFFSKSKLKRRAPSAVRDR
jgi:hypothetical protein